VQGVAAGIERLVRGEVVNETINLAYGEGNSLVAMATYIGEALGIAPDVSVEPSRKGEVTHYVANIEKARRLLGYHPVTPLRDGIRKAVAWSLEWWQEHAAG
jgi:UDP-glucose 4-epimerase